MAIGALLAPACFHPNYDHPRCGPNGECPSGLTCGAELICERSDRQSSDARVSFVIEAEAYSSTTMPLAYQWTSVADEAGYSGVSFMQCLPNDGTFCPTAANVPTCSASLVYQIEIAQPGAYFFHARTLGRTTADDSIWYGVDGVLDLNAMVLPNDGAWHWTTGDSFNLGAGAHTLQVWEREVGARLDALALTSSSTPPP